MAVILSQITIGDTRLIITDAAPNQGSGLSAQIGSMVIVAGQGGIYLKTGNGDTDWKLSTVDAVQLGLDLADLDGRLDVLELDPVTKSYVDAAIANLQGQVSSETSRAQAAEEVLTSDLASEISRAQSVESSLSLDISNEVSSRESEITRVEGLISSEASTRQTEDSNIKDRLGIIEGIGTGSIAKALQDAKDYSDVENSRAMAAEANLLSSVFAETSRAQAAESALQSDLSSEVSRAQSAESTLSERLGVLEQDSVTKSYVDGEVSGLQSQINNITSNVDPAALDSLTEIVAAFQSADSDLNGTISALGTGSTSALGQEISRAQAAEQLLQSHIDSEESARIAGDQSLQFSLNFEISRAQDAESVLQSNIDSEESRAIGVEASLQSQITSEVSRAQSAEDVLSGRLDVLETDFTPKSYVDAEKTRAMLVESSLQSQITSEISDRQSAVSGEQSARQAADTTLQNNINALSSQQIADVTALQSLISLEESARVANDSVNLLEAKQYSDDQDVIKLSEAKGYTDQKISDLINGAPGTLDTLKEIADQLANDESGVSSIINTVATNLQTAKDYADSKVDVEKTRAMSAESSLSSSISQEVIDRQADVDAEESRAMAAEALKLDKAGDTMSGDLNMGGNDVVNVGSIGIGTSSPETVFEVVDNNVKYNIKGSSTSTSGSTNAVVSTITPGSNSVELVKIMVTGIDSVSYDSVTYEKTVKVKNIGGTVSLGVIQSDYTSEDLSMVDANCTFVVSASDVDIRVTGVNNKTITWKCIVERMR